MTEALSLYELNNLIKSVLDESFPDTFLVTAEIASCDVKKHCYMTLVDRQDETIRAEIRTVIWANRYNVIAPLFEEATGTKLAKGIKILFQATVAFHERYGLKLTILNIDPSYTIGELAVRRKEILERLTKEKLIEKNREKEFPLVPQRIGIISSSTAAGYEDLMSHLNNNFYGYRFDCRLYEAAMQGDRAETMVVEALKKCSDDAAALDVVVIVRGGGGETDLSCFDSYEIGRAIAMLPLPLISGIGHHRDRTVVDEVASVRAKTPTAVADFIIKVVKDFEDNIDSLAGNMMVATNRLTSNLKERMYTLSRMLEGEVKKEIVDNHHKLTAFTKGLRFALKVIQGERQKIRSWESGIDHLNPVNVLKRGFSLTYINGKPVKTIDDVQVGDSVNTLLSKGEFTSAVHSKKKTRRKL